MKKSKRIEPPTQINFPSEINAYTSGTKELLDMCREKIFNTLYVPKSVFNK